MIPPYKFRPVAGNENSSFTLFDDDGETAGNLEKGQFETIEFSSEIKGDEIIIRIQSNGGQFPGKPDTREISLLVFDETEHEEIYLNGEKTEYTAIIPSLIFDFDGEPVEIRIKRKG